MNIEMLKIIDFALDNYEKISAFKYLENELYIKVYTHKTVEVVIMEFKKQCFNTIEFDYTVSKPQLIKNDIEIGVEFVIVV